MIPLEMQNAFESDKTHDAVPTVGCLTSKFEFPVPLGQLNKSPAEWINPFAFLLLAALAQIRPLSPNAPSSWRSVPSFHVAGTGSPLPAMSHW